MRIHLILFISALSLSLSLSAPLQAEPVQPAFPDTVEVSPKEPWNENILLKEDEDSPVWARILLWVPNRVLDFIDIFRVDVGAGIAYGGVVRVTKFGQAGFREMAPASLRAGLFGREFPMMVETKDEFGFGPGYVNSADRKVCQGEVGLGADLLLGAYIGVCGEEILDFVAGVFFFDTEDDDIK